MSADSDTSAYAGARSGLGSSEARREAFKWFLLGKLVLIVMIVVPFVFVREYMVEAVVSVPWQLSGVTFLALTFLLGLPAMLVGGGCMLYGIVKAVRIDAER